MSIFGSIMGAIFGKGSAQASASPTAAPSAPPAQTVDVAAIVDKAAAAKGEKLAWRTSVRFAPQRRTFVTVMGCQLRATSEHLRAC